MNKANSISQTGVTNEAHISKLAKLCICGEQLCKGRGKTVRKYSCSKFTAELKQTFLIEVTLDDPSKHLKEICHPCKNALYFHARAANKGIEVTNGKVVYEWEDHKQQDCKICLPEAPKIGQPKKKLGQEGQTNSRHKQPSSTSRQLHLGIQNTTFEVIIPPEFQCPLCLNLLHQPIELTDCQSYICVFCCCEWLRHKKALSCPCCYGDHINDYLTTIKTPPDIILTAFSNVQATCMLCNQVGLIKHFDSHITSNCQKHFTRLDSCSDILAKSPQCPLTPLESKIQFSLLRRSLSNSASPTLQVKTGGQPLTLLPITTPRVASGKASASTLFRRDQQLQSHRILLSKGDDTNQFVHEIRHAGKERKQTLLDTLFEKESTIRVKISAERSLAMKADLQIPWKKIWILRRWYKELGVSIASERLMRAEAKKEKQHNTIEVRNTPMAYVVDLWGKIEDMLLMNDNKSTSVHHLTWHEGSLPQNEVWIKLGGDKGRNSFKMNFQLCNVKNPNSPNNTCVFCLFEAPDTPANLSIALGRYREQINNLKYRVWRGKPVRVFLSGDYEFLCHMYGLSGASGRHCCLWCLTTHGALKNPPLPLSLRTTSTICADYQQFLADGANLKRAKMCNNVIHEPFFKEIPLDQVCPPGLHMSLGIFYRLFSLLESECHKLDLRVRVEDSALEGGTSYSHHLESLEKAKQLRPDLQMLNETIEQNDHLVAVLLMMSDEHSPLNDPRLLQLMKEASQDEEKASKLVEEIDTLENLVAGGFKTQDGPFVKALDTSLLSFSVHRQSYYSGTFVGNHVHRALKAENIQLLCDAVIVHTQRYSVPIIQTAEAISRKFSVAFSLFAKCHRAYNKTIITVVEIDTLEQDIKAFVTYYKDQFPNARVFPKMHMLEKHTIPWLRKWGVGFGLMGEQGAESIHRWFNSQRRIYTTMADGVEQLRCIMKEHFVHIAPTNVALQPPVKKRKIEG